MSKKTNRKSEKDQEILRWVYDPITNEVILYDIFPLFQKDKLKGRDWAIAEILLKNFFLALCDNLDIPEPDVRYSSSGFPAEPTVVRYDAYDDIIYINKEYERHFGDLVFGIAGALRCAWQEHNIISWFSGFKRGPETSIEEFFSQKSMIDSIAYACFAIEQAFDIELQPSSLGFSLDAINERKEYIYKEMLLKE